ncbi:hypothetical protein O5O45_24110 [Hahella aquimaris]|uniref:hypothetical protein n=1 Tax=Hahella sp. HNIBRBA332 TaxID=3015983 RepID=UPI00273A9090|nr:hypothetical protein [Hahella sp. HNIBRBA332]WLQ12815.1 hypothetical protein O5O45_24110 [Hahella sp. HNIBRBA332]
MSDATATDQLEQDIEQTLLRHFTEAHARVPRVYAEHMSSTKAILRRHWTHRRDIPADLMSLPRGLVRVAGKLIRRNKATAQTELSGKEQAMLRIITEELLQLPALQNQIQRLMERHIPELQECGELMRQPHMQGHQQEIQSFLSQRMQSLSGPREGGRDLLVFLLVGALGKSLGGQATFGSAIATGSAMASSLYLAQQSWWGALWVQWAGAPAWVTWSGAAAGVVAAIAIAPLLAPVSEIAVNRLRGERYLHRLVDQVQENALASKADALDAAGLLASYAQLAPDLLALLRSIRP